MLVYCWIEEFRNIKRQGIKFCDDFDIVVKDAGIEIPIEYKNAPDKDGVKYVSKKCYNRKIEINKNIIPNKTKLINNISIILGENATGKSNILDCIALASAEEKYYFLVFYDAELDYFHIKSQNIDIECANIIKKEHRLGNVFSYDICENTSRQRHFFFNPSIYYFSNNDAVAKYALQISNQMIATHECNFSKWVLRDTFLIAFDCMNKFKEKLTDRFKNMGKLVISIDHGNEHKKSDYFSYPSNTVFDNNPTTNDDYKFFFIAWFCEKCLFELLDVLFVKPITLADDVNNPPWISDEKYLELHKLIQFPQKINFPNPEISMRVRKPTGISYESILNKTKEAILFAKSIKYEGCLPDQFNKYLDLLIVIVEQLVGLDERCFTAFYKMEIEVRDEYHFFAQLIDKFIKLSNVISVYEYRKDIYHKLNRYIKYKIEWLSAGEEQFIKLFSVLMLILDKMGNLNSNKDALIIFDEIESNLHPTTILGFMDNLNFTIELLKSKIRFNNLQLIFSTHSQFLVKSCLNENCNFNLVSKKNSIVSIEHKDNSKGISTPMSYAEILYRYFEVVTTDFHNELYNEILRQLNDPANAKYIQNGSEQDKFENFFDSKKTQRTEWYQKEGIKKNGQPYPIEQLTLPTFVRHQIHHSNNTNLGKKLSNGEFCRKYCECDLKESIKLMLNKI